MLASCRCNWSAPPKRRRILPLAWRKRSPRPLPASAGCSSSPPTRGPIRRRDTRRDSDPPDVRDRFLLDGSIQRVRNRLRITVRLLDLRAGNQVVWARPVRPPVERPAVAAGRDRIGGGGADRSGDPADRGKASASRPPMDATAYDLMLRSIPLIGRMEREPFMRAGEYLAHAIELEPDYAAAYAGTPTGRCSSSARDGRTIRLQ